MARVTVELPSLLARFAGGAGEVVVDASSLDRALAALIAAHPALGVHLFDETGALRRHVLCFVNGRNSRWARENTVPLADGDRITILQAVSGG